MAKKFPTQEKLMTTILHGLHAVSGFEKRAGQCKRWCRQVAEAAGVPSDSSPPVGLTAKQCAEWYRDNRPGLVMHNGSLPGDLLFYEVGHGPDGHVGYRMPHNELDENSVAHAPEDEEDGRGTRPLSAVGTPSLVVRLWGW